VAIAPQLSRPPIVGDQKVSEILEQIRQKYDVPAMAFAVITSDGIKWAGVAGVRKRGTEIPADINDQWYLGSKSGIITSVLIAQLVEHGQLQWNTTLAGVFPELTSTMNPRYQKVTMLQLLSLHAGTPAQFDTSHYLGNDVEALRLRLVREELSKPPVGRPGVDFGYSTIDYIVASAVVERITGKSFERAVADEIFDPLQMKSAGFGGIGTPGQIDQPWQHDNKGVPAPLNGPIADDPPIFAPIHASIQDWAALIQDQLRGFRGGGSLLKLDSYKRLETPPCGGNYALGWRLIQPGWGNGTALFHGAPSGGSFASVWVAPVRNFAMVVCLNQAGTNAISASEEAKAEIISLFQKQGRNK
jgi:CubicO group peptidase (beta-lactamase class C family)